MQFCVQQFCVQQFCVQQFCVQQSESPREITEPIAW